MRVAFLSLVVLFFNFSTPCSARRTPKKALEAPKLSAYARRIQRLYQEADTNQDGTINEQEVYEMVLKLYIHVNRQAPMPAPTRTAVRRLFKLMDTTRNDRLSKEEFQKLATLLGQRALTRIITCKVIGLLIAPIFAKFLVNETPLVEKLQGLTDYDVPEGLVKTVLIVLLVNSLGNAALSVVNWVLDKLLPEDNLK